MTLKDVLDKSTQFFKQKKIESPRLDAELLLGHALSMERMQLYLNFDRPMSEGDLSQCRELVKRRSTGEPVAYILGEKEFYGLSFKVNKDVLIPRPETEHIVDETLLWVKNNCIEGEKVKIIDLGTGSGCLAISLAKKIKNCEVVAVDISEEALVVAKKNAEINQVSSQVTFLRSDVLKLDPEVFKGACIVVSNPPYVGASDYIEAGVKAHEPHIALFAEDEGLRLIYDWSQRAINEAKGRNNFFMAFEIGDEHREKLTEFAKNKFSNLGARFVKDYSGLDRVFIVSKNS